jgi:hypothetical protein
VHAVFRESGYAPSRPIYVTPEFREFQEAHAARPGYRGTIVADVGGGRFLTVTLWETADAMNAAREALSPVVERLLNPLMTSPSNLLGTGPVVVNDLAPKDL